MFEAPKGIIKTVVRSFSGWIEIFESRVRLNCISLGSLGEIHCRTNWIESRPFSELVWTFM